MDTLSKKEKEVLEAHLKIVRQRAERIKSPKALFVVAMVGLVGSGKSTVAEALAEEIGAVLISSNDIRVSLRKKGADLKNVREISLLLAQSMLEDDRSVVMDSDHVSADKRNRLKKVAKDNSAQVFYIRTLSDPDVIIGRAINAKYGTKSLYSGAETKWKGKGKEASIKIREMWRRNPLHYSWSREGGGEWIQKTMPYIFEEIDTVDSEKLKSRVQKLTKRMISASSKKRG